MVESGTYFVTEDIALRSGVIESRYRIRDGRFVLGNKDLAMIRFTADEFVTGLNGVEKVSLNEALRAIAENGNQTGRVRIDYTPASEEQTTTEGEEPHETTEEVETPQETPVVQGNEDEVDNPTEETNEANSEPVNSENEASGQDGVEDETPSEE